MSRVNQKLNKPLFYPETNEYKELCEQIKDVSSRFLLKITGLKECFNYIKNFDKKNGDPFEVIPYFITIEFRKNRLFNNNDFSAYSKLKQEEKQKINKIVDDIMSLYIKSYESIRKKVCKILCGRNIESKFEFYNMLKNKLFSLIDENRNIGDHLKNKLKNLNNIDLYEFCEKLVNDIDLRSLSNKVKEKRYVHSYIVILYLIKRIEKIYEYINNYSKCVVCINDNDKKELFKLVDNFADWFDFNEKLVAIGMLKYYLYSKGKVFPDDIFNKLTEDSGRKAPSNMDIVYRKLIEITGKRKFMFNKHHYINEIIYNLKQYVVLNCGDNTLNDELNQFLNKFKTCLNDIAKEKELNKDPVLMLKIALKVFHLILFYSNNKKFNNVIEFFRNKYNEKGEDLFKIIFGTTSAQTQKTDFDTETISERTIMMTVIYFDENLINLYPFIFFNCVKYLIKQIIKNNCFSILNDFLGVDLNKNDYEKILETIRRFYISYNNKLRRAKYPEIIMKNIIIKILNKNQNKIKKDTTIDQLINILYKQTNDMKCYAYILVLKFLKNPNMILELFKNSNTCLCYI